MRKLVIVAGAVMAIGGGAASTALGAPNPAPGGTGQPGAFVGTACGTGNATSQPKGFSTGGFAHAGTVYANGPAVGDPAHAVSEYDIACYQQTQNGH